MNLFRRPQVERELDEALRSCLAILIEETVAHGMARPEARRQALIELPVFDHVAEQVRHAPVAAALGVRPRLGRTFTTSEEQAGAHRVAVISSGMWQRRFGGDPDVLGRSIAVDGEPFSIVGVLPPEVRTPFETRRDLFIPLVLSA